MSTLTCPTCGNVDGAKIVGVQISEVYDGTLYWVCWNCGWAWSRDWTGFGRRQVIADRHVSIHNSTRPGPHDPTQEFRP